MVNTTTINQMLNQKEEVNGETKTVKEILGVKGVFPRWIGIGNLTRNVTVEKDINGDTTKNETRFLSSILNIGDSALERELGVADGFPDDILDENEIMIPQDYADYLGFNETPKETLLRTESHQEVSLTLDFYNFVSSFENSDNVQNMLFKGLSKYAEELFNTKVSHIVKWFVEAMME